MEHNEKTIQDLLSSLYSGNCEYKVGNVYLFRGDWESDYLVVKRNGYCYEFEIKITRADFMKDFAKKDKHDILSTGQWLSRTGLKEHKMRPNRFFYVTLPDIVSPADIPAYAGLMYAEHKLITIKNAPLIHKDKIDLRPHLCTKFYDRWLALKLENQILKTQLNSYRKKYNESNDIII